MDKHRHIIHQQRIEVGMPSGKSPFALQERIRNIYYDKIIPRLDNMFSGIAGEDTIIRIDRLHLDVGAVNVDKLEEELTELVVRALEKSLTDKLKFDVADSGHMEVVSVKRSAAETLLYFLVYGHLPWWSVVDDLAGLEELVLRQLEGAGVFRRRTTMSPGAQELAARDSMRTDDLPARLRRFVEEEEHALARLIFQFSDVFLRRVLSVCYPDMAPADMEPGDAGPVRVRKWRAVFRWAARQGRSGASGESFAASGISALSDVDDPSFGHDTSANEERPGMVADELTPITGDGRVAGDDLFVDDAIREAAEEMKGQPGARGKQVDAKGEQTGAGQEQKKLRREQADARKDRLNDRSAERRKRTPVLDDSDALYPESAGLVLLHPFLTPFFDGLQLLEEKSFRDEEARQKGVHLLGYLATGEEDIEEPRLLFAKMLCGMELTQPVQRNEVLTPEERGEADHLLDVVIGYWKALKNTSKAGLRASFLQRQGKLSRKEDGWQLDVEKKTWDILLGSLPWGYSIIRLPWMKEMVFVNWS